MKQIFNCQFHIIETDYNISPCRYYYLTTLLHCYTHCPIYKYKFDAATIIFNIYFCPSTVTVKIDGYTHSSTLTSGDSVPFGTQIILVCRVVGLPYGTPFSYTWTCPNGPCEIEGYYGRKIYNEHILAVNTTSTSDGGTYTCRVTATGGQEATGNFTLRVNGMSCTTVTLQ